jgi:hypothetical protein
MKQCHCEITSVLPKLPVGFWRWKYLDLARKGFQFIVSPTTPAKSEGQKNQF